MLKLREKPQTFEERFLAFLLLEFSGMLTANSKAKMRESLFYNIWWSNLTGQPPTVMSFAN